jgi:hypothetical protein
MVVTTGEGGEQLNYAVPIVGRGDQAASQVKNVQANPQGGWSVDARDLTDAPMHEPPPFHPW